MLYRSLLLSSKLVSAVESLPASAIRKPAHGQRARSAFVDAVRTGGERLRGYAVTPWVVRGGGRGAAEGRGRRQQQQAPAPAAQRVSL